MNLYRYISFENFIDIVLNSKLTLLNPSCWEDSYEAWFLKSVPNEFKKTKKFSEVMFSSVYAQCWSLNRDSVALWSIYSHNKHAIMIETTDKEIRKLDGVILKKIKYSEDAIIDIDNLATALTSTSVDAWLFPFECKRDGFIYENEVRLFKAVSNNDQSIKSVDVNIPNISDFIKSVTVHPLAEEWYVKIVRSVCEKYGLPFNGKSKLYEFGA